MLVSAAMMLNTTIISAENSVQDQEYTEAGLTPVSWCFTTMPSEEWKNALGTALTAYAAETGTWDDVVSAFVDNWAMEKALSE